VPENLRSIIGQRELSEAIGSDLRVAYRLHAGVVAKFQAQIMDAKRTLSEGQGAPMPMPAFPLSVDQIARKNYEMRLEQDQAHRNTVKGYANISYDDGYAERLRLGIAGRLDDRELAELVIHRINFFIRSGNTSVSYGTHEWRELARALCQAEYEALERTAERDEGDFNGVPTSPLLVNAAPIAKTPLTLPLQKLFDDFVTARQKIGKGREIERRWSPVIKDLRAFLKHDDVHKITKRNLLDWRDEKVATLAPKTISSVYLAAVRAMFNWAHTNDLIKENPAEKVTQEVPKKIRSRERGFTDDEAVTILRATISHKAKQTGNPRTTEAPHTTATINWVPLICAFTGSRPSEITQARAEDFRLEGDFYVLRISPEAGTMKTGMYRDVPLHPQLITLGLMTFVSGKTGSLFHSNSSPKGPDRDAKVMSGNLAGWLQKQDLIPKDVAPNYGWRHRFKTFTNELEISTRVADAIQGHPGKTAADNYGDVNLRTRWAAIQKFPNIDL